MNLISNAYKFTPKGSICTYISLSHTQSIGCHNKTTLKFIVKDTGVGVSEEDRKNLFTMFGKNINLLFLGVINKRRKEFNTKGTGLGLTIAQKLVHRLGGQIYLDSEEGMGTDVTFTIVVEERKFKEEMKVSNSMNCCKITYLASILI